MTVDATTPRYLLDTTVARYKAQGFDVFVEPSVAALPPWLAPYRPDAVAVRPGQKIAIEIVSADPGASEKITRLQDRFRDHPDWELRLIYIAPDTSSQRIDAPPRDAIDRAIRDVITLKETDHLRAALVMGWSTLEAVARAVLPDQLARPQPPANLTEVLASQGYLTPNEADVVRTLGAARNAVAHGQIDTPIEAEQVEALISALRGLAKFLPKNAA